MDACMRDWEGHEIVLWALDLAEAMLRGEGAGTSHPDLDRVLGVLRSRPEGRTIEAGATATVLGPALRDLRTQTLSDLERLASAEAERGTPDLALPYRPAPAAEGVLDRDARRVLQDVEARHGTAKVLGEQAAIAV